MHVWGQGMLYYFITYVLDFIQGEDHIRITQNIYIKDDERVFITRKAEAHLADKLSKELGGSAEKVEVTITNRISVSNYEYDANLHEANDACSRR